MTERDGDLAGRFAELRSRDRARTPAYEAVIAGPRRRPRWVPLLAAAAVAVVAVAGVLRWSRGPAAPDGSWLANWSSPTAPLLKPAGADLVSKVPSLSQSVINLEDQ